MEDFTTMDAKETQKKSYQTPELTVYGTVAEVTQAFGPSSAADLVFVGGSNVPNPIESTGSGNGIIVPGP